MDKLGRPSEKRLIPACFVFYLRMISLMEKFLENRFYVYVHRRLDTGEVFYVGKGSGRRAWSSYKRNNWWVNVVNKVGFTVEIISDCLNENEAFTLEKELVLSFKNSGVTLTNLTDGGEGASGYKYEGEKLERLRGHIEEQWKKRCDPSTYTFYNLTGESFTGTRVEFSEKYNIHSKEVAKLFQSKNKRNVVKNWSLSPISIKLKKKSPQTRRKPSHMDTGIYSFYHVLGDEFVGTRLEFSDYSQIEPGKISGLFCKNPSRSVFGWSLNKLSPEEYTHLKI